MSRHDSPAGGLDMNDAVLSFNDIRQEFPAPGGGCRHPGDRRHRPRRRQRKIRRGDRAQRLRQEHAAADGRRIAGADARHGASPRPRHRCRQSGSRLRAAAGAIVSLEDAGGKRRAAAAAARRRRAPSAASASPRRSMPSASPGSNSIFPTSYPAACRNADRSPARWCTAPT